MLDYFKLCFSYFLLLIEIHGHIIKPLRKYHLTLHENIDLTLLNKLHGPMHYKIGVTCVYNGHMFFTIQQSV